MVTHVVKLIKIHVNLYRIVQKFNREKLTNGQNGTRMKF